MILLLAALALGAEPEPLVCGAEPAPLADSLSVAWVSPLRRTVGANGWMEVVPTSQLRAWIADEHPSVGRLLQRLGERKRADDPHGRWKVTVFEVRRLDLCRPIDGADAVVSGVAVCEDGGNVTPGDSACGWRLDRADGSRSLDVVRVRWRDAAAGGFCVFPAERYIAEVGG